MGVKTTSTESPGGVVMSQSNLSVDSDSYTSGEETKLLRDKREEEAAETKHPYPKSVFFIVVNEFCERFTYYGLRTVLTLFLTQRLFYSEDTATMVFHLFAMIAYFAPVLGAILADSFIGKFNTILYVSIFYLCGCFVLSFGAVPAELINMKIASFVGLFVIAFGTGGIKPCVSAFGGDQFKEGQEKQLQKFFSIFYMAINLGSVFSTLLTPIFRADIKCFGENTCFPAAFGVPALLMVVAVVIFISGKPLYVIKPPEGNIVLKVSQCICHAIGKKAKSSEKKKEHWLDYADDQFDKNLINDIKIVLRVLVLYIPLPVFWALFDQQGSRWTLQATRLDGNFYGFHIKADQLQVINPILIIIYIPLFDYIIYPLFAKCNVLVKPLQRITVGGLLAAVSFVVAALLAMLLEDALPSIPPPGQSELTIINNSPCGIRIDSMNAIPAFETAVIPEIPLGQQNQWTFKTENCSTTVEYDYSFNSTLNMESMMITLQEGKLNVFRSTETKEKAKTGEPLVKLFYNIEPLQDRNSSFKLVRENKEDEFYIEFEDSNGVTEYKNLPLGRFKIYAPYNKTTYFENPVAEYDFKSGGIYIVSVYNKNNEEQKDSVYEIVKGNSIPILYQAPQYMIMTAGEVMLSVTGLEFSYSQSPTSMKSVVQSAWLLTTAFGNLIVIIVAELRLFEKQSYELFAFAALMAVDMVIFAIIAYSYKYVKIKQSSGEDYGTAAAKGKSNEGYVEETDFNK